MNWFTFDCRSAPRRAARTWLARVLRARFLSLLSAGYCLGSRRRGAVRRGAARPVNSRGRHLGTSAIPSRLLFFPPFRCPCNWIHGEERGKRKKGTKSYSIPRFAIVFLEFVLCYLPTYPSARSAEGLANDAPAASFLSRLLTVKRYPFVHRW